MKSAAEYHELADRTRNRAAVTRDAALRNAYDRLAESYDLLCHQIKKTNWLYKTTH